MSEVSLAASAASNSGSRGRGSRRSGSVRSTRTPKRSSAGGSLTPLCMETLRNLILKQFQESTSSPGDSPVKTSLPLEKALASRGVVLASGSITPRRLGFYDRRSHSLRTYQSSLVEDSTLSLATLPPRPPTQKSVATPTNYLCPPRVLGGMDEPRQPLPSLFVSHPRWGALYRGSSTPFWRVKNENRKTSKRSFEFVVRW